MGSASVGLSYGAHSNCVNQVARRGRRQARYLPKLISGKYVLPLSLAGQARMWCR